MEHELFEYSDSDWECDVHTTKSTAGYTLHVSDVLVAW